MVGMRDMLVFVVSRKWVGCVHVKVGGQKMSMVFHGAREEGGREAVVVEEERKS
jgi:hypothetical protein